MDEAAEKLKLKHKVNLAKRPVGLVCQHSTNSRCLLARCLLPLQAERSASGNHAAILAMTLSMYWRCVLPEHWNKP